MYNMQNYIFKCRNNSCDFETQQRLHVEDFDKKQYGNDGKGHVCEKCGFPRMIVAKSNRRADDGFKPGWQPNIREYHDSYSSYKAALKRRGLIEIGYEKQAFNEEGDVTRYWTDDMLKEIYDALKLSDNELKDLKENEVKRKDGKVEML